MAFSLGACQKSSKGKGESSTEKIYKSIEDSERHGAALELDAFYKEMQGTYSSVIESLEKNVIPALEQDAINHDQSATQKEKSQFTDDHKEAARLREVANKKRDIARRVYPAVINSIKNEMSAYPSIERAQLGNYKKGGSTSFFGNAVATLSNIASKAGVDLTFINDASLFHKDDMPPSRTQSTDLAIALVSGASYKRSNDTQLLYVLKIRPEIQSLISVTDELARNSIWASEGAIPELNFNTKYVANKGIEQLQASLSNLSKSAKNLLKSPSTSSAVAVQDSVTVDQMDADLLEAKRIEEIHEKNLNDFVVDPKNVDLLVNEIVLDAYNKRTKLVRAQFPIYFKTNVQIANSRRSQKKPTKEWAELKTSASELERAYANALKNREQVMADLEQAVLDSMAAAPIGSETKYFNHTEYKNTSEALKLELVKNAEVRATALLKEIKGDSIPGQVPESFSIVSKYERLIQERTRGATDSVEQTVSQKLFESKIRAQKAAHLSRLVSFFKAQNPNVEFMPKSEFNINGSNEKIWTLETMVALHSFHENVSNSLKREAYDLYSQHITSTNMLENGDLSKDSLTNFATKKLHYGSSNEKLQERINEGFEALELKALEKLNTTETRYDLVTEADYEHSTLVTKTSLKRVLDVQESFFKNQEALFQFDQDSPLGKIINGTPDTVTETE